MSCMAGLTIAIASVITLSYPELAQYRQTAVSQIALAVILTCIVTPFITQKIAQKKGIAMAEPY